MTCDLKNGHCGPPRGGHEWAQAALNQILGTVLSGI